MFHPTRKISTPRSMPSNVASSSTAVDSAQEVKNTVVRTRNLSYSFAGKPPNDTLLTYRIAADHKGDSVGSVYPMDFCEKEIKDQFSSDGKLVMTGCVKKHDVSIHLNTPQKREPQLKIFRDRTVPIEKEKIDRLPHNLPPGEYQWAELKLQVSKPEKESVLNKAKKAFSAYSPLPSTTDRKRTLFGLYRVDNNGQQHLYMLQPNLTPMPGNPFLAKTPFNRLMYENLMHIHPEPNHEHTVETFLIAQAQPSHIQQGQVDELPGTSASAQYAPALPYRVHPDLRGLQLGAPAIPVRRPSIVTTKKDSVDIDLAMWSKKLLEKEKREKNIAKLQERKAELEREKMSLQEQKAPEETTVQQATLSATRPIQAQVVQKERAKSAAAQKSSPKKIAFTE